MYLSLCALTPFFVVSVAAQRYIPAGAVVHGTYTGTNATSSFSSLNPRGVPDANRFERLFARQSCPGGYSPCTNKAGTKTGCCPTNGVCCIDSSCCYPNTNCVVVFGQTQLQCCPVGKICPGTSPCVTPGYELCPGEDFCCPPDSICGRNKYGDNVCFDSSQETSISHIPSVSRSTYVAPTIPALPSSSPTPTQTTPKPLTPNNSVTSTPTTPTQIRNSPTDEIPIPTPPARSSSNLHFPSFVGAMVWSMTAAFFILAV